MEEDPTCLSLLYNLPQQVHHTSVVLDATTNTRTEKARLYRQERS